MATTTALVTLLSPFAGAQGRESWTLTLDADPGVPVWVGYGVDMRREPGPYWTVPGDTLSVSQGGPGRVAPGQALYLFAPLGVNFSFAETARTSW